MTNSTPICRTLGLAPSFGFGDRTGLATPGHVAAMRQAGAGLAPIFAQQSAREWARTGRTPQQVMSAAEEGMRRTGWDSAAGADADHLKTPQEAEVAANAGFTFFTLDPSADVDPHADTDDESTLEAKFKRIADRISWLPDYVGKRIQLPSGTRIEFTQSNCRRCAVKYGLAIERAIELADRIRRIQEAADRDYEIELSVDETNHPTTLAEHYIIADQCLRHGTKLVSLAPRFIGEFEKGVDYKGDVAALERSIRDHTAIAELLGGYKISLHSGSDKISVYPALARATRGSFHVKTSGTSYLEALRVVLRHEPVLFREIVRLSRGRYDSEKATYHVSATLDDTPTAEAVASDFDLERIYLGVWADVPSGEGFTCVGRQILHCAYGSVLTDAKIGPELRSVLESHSDTYREMLCDHFTRHLEALQSGM